MALCKCLLGQGIALELMLERHLATGKRTETVVGGHQKRGDMSHGQCEQRAPGASSARHSGHKTETIVPTQQIHRHGLLQVDL